MSICEFWTLFLFRRLFPDDVRKKSSKSKKVSKILFQTSQIFWHILWGIRGSSDLGHKNSIQSRYFSKLSDPILDPSKKGSDPFPIRSRYSLHLPILASRLVKSSDSHASDPCSRLSGSSWQLWNYFISEFNEKGEIFLTPPCVNVGKQAALKRQTQCTRKPTIAVCQHAAFKRQTRCMRKPTTACQRANSKVLGPAVYKNIAEFNEIENSLPYNGEDGAD